MVEEISSRGPLTGLRVIEFTGIGPGPHCAMLLCDLGAEVLRIDRPGGNGWPNPVVDRGRAVKEIDIRKPEGRDWCVQAARYADVVIEGYRPGVMERLGLGPDHLSQENPRLIYGRITGWGQTGTLSHTAGHDLNYIALTGALAAIGQPGQPASVPLNLIGDFGGGSMLLALGIIAAVVERERSGLGQVVDAAIVDGVASMMSMFDGLAATGRISLDRDANILGGAAPFYRCYLCRDGREVALGAIEPAFFATFLDRLGLPELAVVQYDTTRWAELAGRLAGVFATQDRDHWAVLFADSDACLAPVLSVDEAHGHAHHLKRATYIQRDGVHQVRPVPRFSRSPGAIQDAQNAEDVVARWAQSIAGRAG